MTYSIVARDRVTGQFGIAVASRFFAVGALVPHIRGGRCAVATQAFVNPLWGVEGARRLAEGEDAPAVMADFIARDGGQRQRQCHMIDSSGVIAAHTGEECIDWCGHTAGEGVSVAGNMLEGPEVIEATRASFEANGDLPFADRLLLAMRAGEEAGGDKRGRQSACLRIHRGEDYPWLDLRADDHADPLTELERLLAVARERFIHVAETMATHENFSGMIDRREIDERITTEEKRRLASGRPTRSFATQK
ncbi:MAG: DUF1028 domain-containing protein [Geminicoccaceae bacterium]